MSSTNERAWVRRIVLASTVAAAIGLAAAPARAEGPATPDGKGIAGGILLGAEIVMITEAIIGIESWWPYPVFGALGAGAGAVGGWGVEQTDSAEASLYMLAGGMALVVPTLVAVLNATAYDPETDETLDEGVEPKVEGDEPSVEGEAELGAEARHRIPPALVGLDGGGVAMGVPAVEFRPAYTPEEQARFGVEQALEVRVPVVWGAF